MNYRINDMMTLEDRILSALQYGYSKRLSGPTIQYYLNDSLNRYCHKFDETEPLINYIKQFHLNPLLKNRYDELVKKYNINLTENNKLLLKKCVCLEFLGNL